MKLTTFEIDGREYTINVTEDGQFWSELLGDMVRAPSKKALVEKLRTEARRRARICVPATVIETDGYGKDATITFRAIEITGVHGSNRKAIYREVGKSETEREGYSEQFSRRLSEAEVTEAVRLHTAYITAEQAWEQWRETHEVHVGELIEEWLRTQDTQAGAEVEDAPR